MNKNLALGLGSLTGFVGLIAMLRLISGAFSSGLSTFAWVFLLLAMVPWVGYTGWRARHGRLTPTAGLAVGVLGAVGLVAVWMMTGGAVVALAASLAAFAVIWVHDWPAAKPVGESRIVGIDELVADTADEPGVDEEPADAAAGRPAGESYQAEAA